MHYDCQGTLKYDKMTLNFEWKSELEIEGCWFTQMFLPELGINIYNIM